MNKSKGETLDRLYNNRARVPGFAAHFAHWAETSELVRQTQSCLLDVAYGDGPSETLDIFPADCDPAPVLVFLHGGYWRSLDKADHSFIAPAFAQAGVCVVIPNYALCPEVSIPDIVMQMVKALAWTYRHIEKFGGDPHRITVVGHSAGGHLAAMMLACLWPHYAEDLPAHLVKNALTISGVYALEAIRQTPFLQESLQLTSAQVQQASPAWLPSPGVSEGRGVLYTVVGGEESSAFLQHNHLIRQSWGVTVVPVCEVLTGLNHFSILEALIEPGHRLNALATRLLMG
ncbi:MAG: alpha/beta hydrolase [Rhodoferax sp.]|uniref:alpha/beta hydrolase n=1 Tax=Rhodoferax sp. TaxID=50421 RepID=UPI00301A96E6